jgi:hypothetical protein
MAKMITSAQMNKWVAETWKRIQDQAWKGQ